MAGSSSRFLRALKLTDWATAYCVIATLIWAGLGLWILHLSKVGADYDFLDKLGGYLGGFFSPIAIFWLVRGFYLQRDQAKESAATLEKNTYALLQQADALRRLVATAEARESRAIDPVFRIFWGAQAQGGFFMSIENKGHDVADLAFYTMKRDQVAAGLYRDGDALEDGSGFLHWLSRGHAIQTTVWSAHGVERPIRVRLTFRRVDGTMGEQVFESYRASPAASFNRVDLN